jgi:hypothetical protein
MRNPHEVLRHKEQEILKVRKEIDALRITARLLEEPRPSDGQILEMPDPGNVLCSEPGPEQPNA